MHESGSTEESKVALLALLKQIEQRVESATDISTLVETSALFVSMNKLAGVRQLRIRDAPNEAALSRIDLDVIRIAVTLPVPSKPIDGLYGIVGLIPATTIDEYFANVVDTLRAIDCIYSLYALVKSGSGVITDFVRKVHADPNTVSNALLHRFLATAEVEPLRLLSAYYGSPASFDFLGAGKILEILRDTIKDLVWRGKHEKQTAELERRSKEIEIERMKLETEKTSLEIATRELEIIEKTMKLKLPVEEKRVIISVLLPKMVTVAQSSATALLLSTEIMPLLDNGRSEERLQTSARRPRRARGSKGLTRSKE